MGLMIDTQKDPSDQLRQLASYHERGEVGEVLFSLRVYRLKGGDLLHRVL